MGTVRRFLWKYLGVTLDKRTFLLGGACLLSCLAIIIFGILLAITNDSIFRVLVVLMAIPGELVVLGGGYRAFSWLTASKSEREELEREIALRQLKRRVEDKHFQR